MGPIDRTVQGHDFTGLRLAAISILLLLALVSDIKSSRIKNSLTYGFMLAGLTLNLAAEGTRGLLFSLEGILLPAVCLIVLYKIGAIGAGDIKLLSALGSVMGPDFALWATVFSFLCGGFIALALMLLKGTGMEGFRYFATYVRCCLLSMKLLQYADLRNGKKAGSFHFSIAIAAGTAAAAIVHWNKLLL